MSGREWKNYPQRSIKNIGKMARVTENKGGIGKNEVMKEEVRSNQERHGSLLSDYREIHEQPLKTQGSKSHVEFPFTQTINEFGP